MRQVPHYLVIGNGRVARHFQHYFSLLNLSFSAWHRKESLEKLHSSVEQSSHILVLINDSAIDDFIQQHLHNAKATIVHFSGSLVSRYAFGAHPLIAFTHNTYTLEQYQSIPFVIDNDAPVFENLLPGLLNKNVRLNKSQKEKYHALCVLSGNFSTMLWQKMFSAFETELNLPAEIAHVYLQQCTKTLSNDYQAALTGPLVRNDVTTIKKNIDALNNDPFQEIYKSFVSCYQKIQEEEAV